MFGSPPRLKLVSVDSGSPLRRTEMVSSSHRPCGAVSRMTTNPTALIAAAWNQGDHSSPPGCQGLDEPGGSATGPAGPGDVNMMISNGTCDHRVEGSMPADHRAWLVGKRVGVLELVLQDGGDGGRGVD